MLKRLLYFLRQFIRPLGIDITRYPDPISARIKTFFDLYNVDVVFDIGANTGQYGTLLRDIGYTGKIISFEPQANAYAHLCRIAKRDPYWTTVNMALGNEEGTLSLNIASNSCSSSILEMNSDHIEAAPESIYNSTQPTRVARLDTILHDYCTTTNTIFLKMDVQGYEKNVLDGALNILDQVTGIQIEMSLTELYKGELLFDNMRDFLKSKGFELCLLDPGFYNHNTGKLLQVDGVFYRLKQA